MYMNTSKQGSWQTVKSTKEKKQAEKKKEPVKKDRLGVSVVDPVFAAFDRAFAEKPVQQEDKAGYKGAFAGLVNETPAVQHARDDGSDSDEESTTKATANGVAGRGTAAASAAAKVKQPKKPKLSVAQVAAGIDVATLQSWMAEIQQKYSANETAQLQALSDKLLGSFKEASLDLGKLVATKGLEGATAQPASEVPNALMNALASFVASMSEPALASISAQLTTAVVVEAAGAGPGAAAGTPPGKGKAGLPVMLAVILRTRPQVLVQAAPELRAVGRQVSGTGRLPLLLWVINQAATADPSVGVAVWVRLLLPQLLGIAELPASSAAAKGSGGPVAAVLGKGNSAELLQPLDTALQAQALEYLSSLLQKLGGSNTTAAARRGAGDVILNSSVEPTVPGSAVEVISRLVAGKAVAAAAAAAAPSSAGGAAAAAAAAAGEGKKAVAARNAAAAGLTPLLPGLTALAASTSCAWQYSDWLLLALETAGLSAAAPESPDALVERSASNVVACLCGSDACFDLWETKHKGQLRGSARVLAAMQQRPQLLQPLLAQRPTKEAFRRLLAALPARHRTHLSAGKGWQGACARVAEDACQKLPRKLGGSWGPGSSRAGGSGGGRGGGLGLLPLLGLTAGLTGVLVMAGLHRREVAGIISAYAGKDTAQAVDDKFLGPLEVTVQRGLVAAEPVLQQLKPALDALQPAIEAARPTVEALVAKVQQVVEMVQQQVEEIIAEVKRSDADITLE